MKRFSSASSVSADQGIANSLLPMPKTPPNEEHRVADASAGDNQHDRLDVAQMLARRVDASESPISVSALTDFGPRAIRCEMRRR